MDKLLGDRTLHFLGAVFFWQLVGVFFSCFCSFIHTLIKLLLYPFAHWYTNDCTVCNMRCAMESLSVMCMVAAMYSFTKFKWIPVCFLFVGCLLQFTYTVFSEAAYVSEWRNVTSCEANCSPGTLAGKEKNTSPQDPTSTKITRKISASAWIKLWSLGSQIASPTV